VFEERLRKHVTARSYFASATAAAGQYRREERALLPIYREHCVEETYA